MENIHFSLELATIFTRMSKKSDSALSVHGISFTEYRVLHALVEINSMGKMRRIDLAEILGLSASGVTRLLLPLTKIGLVDKVSDERDARVSFVLLTEAGHRLYEEASVSLEFSMQKFLSRIKEKEMTQVVEVFEKI